MVDDEPSGLLIVTALRIAGVPAARLVAMHDLDDGGLPVEVALVTSDLAALLEFVEEWWAAHWGPERSAQ